MVTIQEAYKSKIEGIFCTEKHAGGQLKAVPLYFIWNFPVNRFAMQFQGAFGTMEQTLISEGTYEKETGTDREEHP